MNRLMVIGLFLVAMLLPGPVACEAKSAVFVRAQASIQRVLEEMSGQLNRFEEIQRNLTRSSRNNDAYDEEKNMWISVILAVTTIASVCEYENDLLSLFLDLNTKRRPYFYDVRIQSLNSSILQIKILKEQIRINYSLISIRPEEKALFEEINRAIDVSVLLLTDSLKTISTLKQATKK